MSSRPISSEQAPRVIFSHNRQRKIGTISNNVIPAWSCLPIPGTCLSLTRSELAHPEKIHIDVKRIYHIGSSFDADIVVPELGKIDIKLYHHKNGSVYMAVPKMDHCTFQNENGSRETNIPGMIALDVNSPFQLGDVKFTIQRNTPCRTLREHLRTGESVEDDTTRSNTIKNRIHTSPTRHTKVSAGTRSTNQTPASVKSKTKRRRWDPEDIGKPRSVRFLE
jgi:hypothetical protein